MFHYIFTNNISFLTFSEKKASKGKDSRNDTSDEEDGSQSGRNNVYFLQFNFAKKYLKHFNQKAAFLNVANNQNIS